MRITAWSTSCDRSTGDEGVLLAAQQVAVGVSSLHELVKVVPTGLSGVVADQLTGGPVERNDPVLGVCGDRRAGGLSDDLGSVHSGEAPSPEARPCLSPMENLSVNSPGKPRFFVHYGAGNGHTTCQLFYLALVAREDVPDST